jgi:hypothetical protein
MTVGIAAFCEVDGSTQTGKIVIAADMKISYSDEDATLVSSNEVGRKIYDLPHGFYCLVAGDSSKSHEFVSALYGSLEGIERSDPRFVFLVKQSLLKTLEYLRLRTRTEMLAEWNVTVDEFLHDAALQDKAEIHQQLKDASYSFECILAGFTGDGAPVLFSGNCIRIDQHSSPGFFCIGAGKTHATDWLNFRKQNGFLSAQRTYYHVREATNWAQLSPVVGSTVNMLLLQHDKPPVDVGRLTPLMEGWHKEFFPKDTAALDKPEARRDFAQTFGVVAA